jgi:hypothetical protein
MAELNKELLDIKIEKHQNIVQNPINHPRLDEPWTIENEELLQEWAAKCIFASNKHDAQGKIDKHRYRAWAIPNMILTVVMSGLSGALNADEYYTKYITIGAFVTSGLITGISSLYNFGKSQEKHFNFSTNYAEIALEIKSELTKGRPFRTQADVFSQKMMMKFENLNRNAPNL